MLLLKFAGPCFGVLLYLTVVYIWDKTVMASVSQSHTQVLYAQQRRVQVHVLNNAARSVAVPSHTTLLGAAVSYEDAFAAFAVASTAQDMLLVTENGLLFGNYFWDLPSNLDSNSVQV